MRYSGALFFCVVYCASMGHVSSTAGQPRNDLDACRSAKQTDGVIEACSRAIQDTAWPNPVRAELLLKRAWLYTLNRQRDLAVPDYTAAIELDPGNVQARKLRGLAYAGRDEFDRSLADYDEAIRLSPDDAEGYRERGDVRVLQRAFGSAVEDYRKAIALDPKGLSASLMQCRISASLFTAFFHCTGIAFDMAQPASSRAEARTRLDELQAPIRTDR
jgi:tetratricopeptide (TPR) repeat protein